LQTFLTLRAPTFYKVLFPKFHLLWKEKYGKLIKLSPWLFCFEMRLKNFAKSEIRFCKVFKKIEKIHSKTFEEITSLWDYQTSNVHRSWIKASKQCHYLPEKPSIRTVPFFDEIYSTICGSYLWYFYILLFLWLYCFNPILQTTAFDILLKSLTSTHKTYNALLFFLCCLCQKRNNMNDQQ